MSQTQPQTACALSTCTNPGRCSRKCRRCNTPIYCSKLCVFRDIIRHRSECETLVPYAPMPPIVRILRAYGQKHESQLAGLALAHQGRRPTRRPVTDNIKYTVILLKEVVAHDHQSMHNRVAFDGMAEIDTDDFVATFQFTSNQRNAIVKLNVKYTAITILFLYTPLSGNRGIFFDHFPLREDTYDHRIVEGIEALQESERIHMDT